MDDVTDPWVAGYRAALALQYSQSARESVLRRAVPDEKWIAGFLCGHEQFIRNARCTCGVCPIHNDVEVPMNPEAS